MKNKKNKKPAGKKASSGLHIWALAGERNLAQVVSQAAQIPEGVHHSIVFNLQLLQTSLPCYRMSPKMRDFKKNPLSHGRKI